MRTPYAFMTIALAIASTSSDAQTLNQTNHAPVAGQVINSYQAPYLAPGPAGASQTWNFSALTTGPEVTSTYVTPASTGYAASFPGANLAASDGQGNFAFYVVNSTGQEVAGVYSAAASANVTYQNTQKFITYPCSFNTTWTDNFSSNFSISGISFVRSGTITGTADGFGTLVMPYGTVTNVLRVRTVEDYSDVSIIGTIEYDFTNYYYYRPGTPGPIVGIYDQFTNQLGTPVTNQYAIWLTTNPASILENNANAIGIDLFPNPATDQLNVVFGSVAGSTQLELMDATGRLVRSENFSAVGMGINRTDMDVSGLTAGSYLLRITASNGDQGTKRLMVQ